jgi:hypothetical protein
MNPDVKDNQAVNRTGAVDKYFKKLFINQNLNSKKITNKKIKNYHF